VHRPGSGWRGVPSVLAVWILSLLAAAAPDAAPRASGAVHGGEPRVRATLLADVTQVEPSGTFCGGVRLQTARGWHGRQDPGEVGLPTQVPWDVPRVHRAPVLLADGTRREGRITRALAAHGRAGVPMSLPYSPVSPDRPGVLPELHLRWGGPRARARRGHRTRSRLARLSSPRRGDPGDRFAAARSFDQSSRRPSRQAGLRLESSAGW